MAQQYFDIGVTSYHVQASAATQLAASESNASSATQEVQETQSPRVPVILIHAFPIDHRMWDKAAEQLIAHFDSDANTLNIAARDIYAFEMPGAGGTPIPTAEQTGEVAEDGAYTQAMDRMAESFVAKLHELGYRQAIWVGISMGGYAVLAIHRLFAEAVQGLVLCDTKAGADMGQARANRLRIAQICETEHTTDPVMHFVEVQPHDSEVKRSPEFIEQFTSWIRSQNPLGIAWRQRMAAGRTDETPYLSRMDVPVGIICGDRDPSSPPEAMAQLADQIEQSTLIEPPSVVFTVIYHAGHFSCVEQPQVFADALYRFIARVDGVHIEDIDIHE